jgi:hypothetical protein
MTEFVPSAALPAAPATAKAARTGVLDRLTWLGWRWGLAAILAGMVLSFVLFGYRIAYYRNADMDFMLIYNALVMNDGKPQAFFDHPAYLSILALKSWFSALHALGLLDAWTLSALPPASDGAAFEAAMTAAVHAGRVLVLLLALGCVLVFAALSRTLLRDWRVALLATQALALSGGLAVHSRILRSELLATMPVIFALMVLIMVGRRASPARPLALAVAAALCVIGLENKVQVILLFGMLPIMILPFGGPASRSAPFWISRAGWLATGLAFTVAGCATWLALPLLAAGFDRMLLDAAQLRPLLLDRFGIYQAALALFIVGCMVAYAAIWRISTAETLTSMAAMVAGAMLALLLLNIDYDARNVIAIFNPLEKMLTFADTNTLSAAHGSGPMATILLLLQGFGSVLARYTFVFQASARPTVFLTWLIVPGIVLAWRRGERLLALQALLLLLAAAGIDTLDVRRGLKVEYFVLSDPLIILAGALLLDRLSDISLRHAALPIGYALLGLHIAVGQAEPVKYAFQRKGPESICQWRGHYLPLLELPWCPPQT